jgi:hypothetical protein
MIEGSSSSLGVVGFGLESNPSTSREPGMLKLERISPVSRGSADRRVEVRECDSLGTVGIGLETTSDNSPGSVPVRREKNSSICFGMPDIGMVKSISFSIGIVGSRNESTSSWRDTAELRPEVASRVLTTSNPGDCDTRPLSVTMDGLISQ